MKRTKIIATIGPACESKNTLKQMMKAGMNIARLNFSHGTYENHSLLIANIRAAAKETEIPIGIIQDVQGPKIRLGVLPKNGIALKKDTTVVLDTQCSEVEDGKLPLTLDSLHEYIQSGERILLADGTIELLVTQVKGTAIYTTVVIPGTVYSHKGINIPDTNITLSALTVKDKKDLYFGVSKEVDMVAVSFVRSAEDIVEARSIINTAEQDNEQLNTAPIKIIAKIERPDAVAAIDEIIAAADGIMVARGDLGIEIPAAEVPLVQKMIIEKCMAAAKPVIVATQMLDSMQDNPRPTRAEVSDVANAVIDHTDAVMLSNETATGTYPVETVQMMHDIIVKTEVSKYDDYVTIPMVEKEHPIDEIITSLSRTLSDDSDAKIIITRSISGKIGYLISRNRPELPIVVITHNERVQRQLQLSWGVYPLLFAADTTLEQCIEDAVELLKEKSILQIEDTIVIVGSEEGTGEQESTHILEMKKVT